MSASRIRVLEVTTSLDIGGAEILLMHRARWLAAIGFDVTVCSMKSGGALCPEFLAAGLSTVELGSRSLVDPRPARRLARLLRNGRFSVVHCHLFRARLWGVPLARAFAVPLVLQTEHALSADGIEGRPNTWAIRSAAAVLGRLSHRTIAVSRATADALSDLHRVAREKIEVIPNGIDLAELEQDAHGRAPVVDVVGLGRLHRDKGFDVLLRALALARARGRTISCEIAGTGTEEALLRTTIVELGLEGTVRLVGPVRTVGAFLRRGRVAVIPSRTETFGVTALEAMAVGVPVVASDVGGLSELIQDRSTGYLVPPDDPERLADAILHVVADSRDAERVAGAGRLVAAHYDIRRTSEELAALYASSST